MSLTIPVAEIINNSINPLLAIDPSWERVPLGKVAKILNGYAFKSELFNDTKGTPLIRIRDINNNKTDCYYDGAFDETYVIHPGDLLIGMDGDFNCTTWRGPKALLNQRVCKIEITTEQYDRNFFEYVLPGYLKAINENTSAQTVKHLSSRSISEILLPNPPLAEQQRIVACVEALLSHVDAAGDRLSRVPAIMKKFRQAVLASACSGRLTEEWREENPDVEPAEDALLRCKLIATTQKPLRKIRRRGTVGMPEIDLPEDLPNTWTIKKIKEFVDIGAVTDYQDGNHGGLYPRTTDFGDVGIKFLTATQVFDNDVRLSEAPLLKIEKASKLRIGFAKPRDVLLTHNATVGRVALMPDNCGEIILGTSVTYYRLNPEFIDPSYCCYTMQGQLWQSQLRAIMEQTTRNQVSITKQAEFYLPLPPLAEQREIVRRVGLLFERADAIEREVAAAGRRCERLTQAVMVKAFSGRL